MLRAHSLLLLILLPAICTAQSTMDTLLASIARMNKTILAQERQQEAAMAQFRTGLSLPDPELTVDWMQGFPSSAGSQTDITAAQAFDFPTAYKFRREIASFKSEQISSMTAGVRRKILLEAKHIALELIYLNKSRAILDKRLSDTEAFYENYRNKLEQQDATILDVRKAQLRLLNVRTELKLVEVEIQSTLQELTQLNGGEPVTFTDTVYPQGDLPLDPESIIQQTTERDAELQALLTQERIAEAETRLTESLLLPGFEAGYRYQGLAGQNFHGIHAGVRVPLWENKKRTTASRLYQDLSEARTEERRTALESRIKRQYNAYREMRQMFDSYAAGLEEISGQLVLDKALKAGQITVLDYFVETTIFYETQDQFLELEASLYKLVAELMQYNW